jgi:protein archease
MTDLKKVRPREERAVSASGDDASSLVVAYLTQLLQIHEPDGFLASRIEVRPIGSPATALVASLEGEPFDPDRHTVRTEVKAVTLHHLVFDVPAGRARVIVDI